MEEPKPIYLDYNATTPIAKEVADEMAPYLYDIFGNPSSSHPYGVQAKLAVEKSRQQVAEAINCQSNEIIFTSGGTESNNYAIRGYALANRDKGNHIITTAVEHPAVTEVCRYLATQGFHITTLPVDSFGQVSPEDLKAALRPETILVSIMHANNEVGTIQPITILSELTHQAGALFHTDAAQSIGKIPVDVDQLGVDLLSIAGHKLYAPKGVGALYIRGGLQIENVMFGAGQERGLHPGTENVLEIVGLGKAAQQAGGDLDQNRLHFKTMRDKLHRGLEAALTTGMMRLNGHPEDRLPNTLNISFKNIEANLLLEKIQDRVAASAGAACHAGNVRMSGVLEAMGVTPAWGMGTVRFSVGRMTTAENIDKAITVVVDTVQSMRMSNNQ